MHEAHTDLEVFCLDKEVYRVKQSLNRRLSDFVYNGFWFSPEGQYVRNCIALAEENVNGTVKLELYKGNGTKMKVWFNCLKLFWIFTVFILGRSSDICLYNEDLVSMDKHADFSPADATGFINIHAIRLKEYNRFQIMNRK